MNVAVLGQTDPKRVKAQRARGGFEVKVFGPRCTVFGGPYTNASDFPDAWRVNMADEHRGDSANVFVPTRDFSLPPEKEFRRALVSTVMALYLGMDVYVGCMGGSGRTGTFLAVLVAALDKAEGVNPTLTRVARVRALYSGSAVETDAQKRFVEGYDLSIVMGMIKGIEQMDCRLRQSSIPRKPRLFSRLLSRLKGFFSVG